MSGELFRGDASYQPKNWAIRATVVGERQFRAGRRVRRRQSRRAVRVATGPTPIWPFQELFYEMKAALTCRPTTISSRSVPASRASPVISAASSFSDNEPGVRLFGNYDNNRWQYNLAWFYQLEKDTNSGLNTFNGRDQNVFIANLYRQDFFFPGYTAQLSFHANIDQGAGSNMTAMASWSARRRSGPSSPANVYAYYFGWAGDGHIGRLNISHQFYQVIGNETFNQIAGRSV